MWEEDLLINTSLLVRFVFEVWAAAHYANKVIIDMKKTKNIKKALKNVNSLLLGARSPVKLPFGGDTKEKSIHINDFIRSLKDVES
ncbi:MAG: hypothetical protein KKA19_03440 [Candidatus Margulisbacteria bacterium]|nr:hypothetical protein [Candidatus Margulisiibacteriota bacterium]